MKPIKLRIPGILSLLAASWMMLFTTSLDAQCDPGGGLGGTGADVIVGELTGTQSYGSAGGYYAFSVAATSCNVGTEELLWLAKTNQHPVIGQNMFRQTDGLRAQTRLSWPKHDITAVHGNT